MSLDSLRAITIADIDDSDRLRPLNPKWVANFAEQVTAGADIAPIEVVERSGGAHAFRLMAGAHRLQGHRQAGRETIVARVFAEIAYPTEAAVRQREIDENVQRYDLTVLDRAVFLATWRDIYEAGNLTASHGGKRRGSGAEIKLQDPATWSDDASDAASQRFAARFSTAAAQVLGISERSIFASVRIARRIPRDVRNAIAFWPLADNQTELLQLAAETPERQAKIVRLIGSEAAARVADAIAILDRVAPAPRLGPVEKLADRFARLKETEQHAFFAAHAEAINAWLAAQRMKAA